MKKQKQQNKKEVEMKVTKFYFWNQGKSYQMLVTAPEDVPYYRLKEIFDKNFVGKGDSITFDPNVFSRTVHTLFLNRDYRSYIGR